MTRANIPLSRWWLGAQIALLLALVALFVSPTLPPDPWALGGQLSWALMCLVVSGLVCVTALLTGAWPSTRVDAILAAYVACAALSAVASVNHWETLKAAILLVAQIGLFYATVAMTRRVPRFGTWVLLVLLLGASLVELMAFGYHMEIGLFTRPAAYAIPLGWSGYPELGALGALQFGVLVGALLGANRWSERAAVGALALVAAAEILFLYSRTAWAAAVLVVVVAGVFAGPQRRVWLATAAGGAIIVVALGMTNPSIRYLVDNALGRSTVPHVAGVAPGAPSSRLQLWQKTGRMILDHPIAGVGLGNFRWIFETRYNPELNADARRGVHAHNLWLEETAETGIPGGLAYLALWGGIAWMAGRSALRARSAVTLATLLAIVAAIGSNFTDSVPSQIAGVRVFLVTWVIFGIAAAQSDDAR